MRGIGPAVEAKADSPKVPEGLGAPPTSVAAPAVETRDDSPKVLAELLALPTRGIGPAVGLMVLRQVMDHQGSSEQYPGQKGSVALRESLLP